MTDRCTNVVCRVVRFSVDGRILIGLGEACTCKVCFQHIGFLEGLVHDASLPPFLHLRLDVFVHEEIFHQRDVPFSDVV